jgi:hypothetical protein
MSRLTTLALCFAPALALADDSPLRPSDAHVLIRVAVERPSITPQSSGKSDIEEWKIYKRTLIELAKSPLIFQSALREKSVADAASIKTLDHPMPWLAAHARVEDVEGTELIRIGVTGADFEESSAITQAIANSLLRNVVDRDKFQKLERHARLTETRNSLLDVIRSKRLVLRKISEMAGTNSAAIGPEHDSVASRAIERELAELRAEMRKTAVTEQILSAKQEPSETEANSLLETKRRLQALQLILELVEKERESMLGQLQTQKSAKFDLEEVTREIAQLEKTLNAIEQTTHELQIEISAPPRVTIIQQAAAVR